MRLPNLPPPPSLLLVGFALMSLVSALVYPVHAQSGEWTGSWGLPGVNGSILAIVESGGRLYVGGGFTTAGSEHSPGLAAYHLSEGRWQRCGSGVRGTVAAIAAGPDGALYVGGAFGSAGNISADNIARYDPEADEWSPLGIGIEGFAVDALIFGPDGSLYAGGRFETAGGVAARNIARWDGTTWESIGDVGENSGDGVTSLAFGGDILYVGGYFSMAGGVEAENIVSFDTGTMTWEELGGGVDRAVLPGVDALLISDEGVFVGGSFDQAIQPDGDALAVNNVTRWDPVGETWNSLGEGTEDLLHAMAFGPDGLLYATGEWEVGEAEPELLRRWDGQMWEAVGLGPAESANNYGHYGASFLASGDRLYMGFIGYYLFEGNNPNSFLHWYEPGNEKWGVLGGPGTDGFTEDVFALATGFDGVTYAGGLFRFAGTEQVDYVARWDVPTESWAALGRGMNQPVGELLVHRSGSVYVGGAFSEAYEGEGSTVVAHRIARWDPQAERWAALGGGIRSGGVGSLTEAGDGTLYVGGSFSEVHQSDATPLAVEGIARWDPGAEVWEPVPGGHGLGGIGALAFDDSEALYASGSYIVDETGERRGRVARLDPETSEWTTLREWDFASAWELVVTGDPMVDGALYVGTYSHGVWRWKDGAWTSLGGPSFVYSLARNGDPEAGGELYAGGVNADASGPYLQRWNGASWSRLGSGLTGFVSPPLVHALAVGEAETEGRAALWVGGEFIAAGGEPASCIARWETEDFGTDAEGGAAAPQALQLEVYPNPASGPLAVRYALPEAGSVRLAVYDMLGREVVVLADGVRAAGMHEVPFERGMAAAGIYVVRLKAGTGAASHVQTQRVTVIR